MNRNGHPESRWRILRQLGRFGFALAAGGAFAALSWNPAPPSEQNDKQNSPSSSSSSTARSGAVTDDGTQSHYNLPTDGILGEDQWGLIRDRAMLDVSERGRLYGSNAALETEEHAPTVPAEESGEETAAFQQPRGPP